MTGQSVLLFLSLWGEAQSRHLTSRKGSPPFSVAVLPPPPQETRNPTPDHRLPLTVRVQLCESAGPRLIPGPAHQ